MGEKANNNRKLYFIAAIVSMALIISIAVFQSGDSYKQRQELALQAQFDAIYATDPTNIVAVGKNFIGVKELDENMDLPSGYTFDMVYEMGDIVFTDETITVTQQVPNIKCYIEVTATSIGEQPTQTCTQVPEITSTPEPNNTEINVSVSAVGRYVNGNTSTACTRGPWVYSISAKKWGWAPNAHCITKAVVNKYGSTVPAYLESAGEYISPSTYDGGSYPDNSIGIASYWFPFQIGTSTMTYFDNGFVEAFDQSANHYIYDDKLPQIASISQTAPAINTVMIGEGRTTGVTMGKVAATGVSIYMSVGYNATTVHYADQVIIIGYGDDTYISKGGDSGKTWRPYTKQTEGTCQNWAGNSSGTYSVCGLWYRIFKSMHYSLTE